MDQDPELSQILSQDSKLLEIDQSIDLGEEIKVAGGQHEPAPSERILTKGEAPNNTRATSEVLDQNSDSKTILGGQHSNP